MLAAGLVAAPAQSLAQSGSPDEGDGHLRDELERAFRDLMDEVRPALDEFLETLEVLDGIDSLEHYQRPEVLPNGDIIIRRRPDAPQLPPPLPRKEEPEPEGGVKT